MYEGTEIIIGLMTLNDIIFLALKFPFKSYTSN